MEITIRLLTEQDLPFAMELKNLAGWNQTETDWLAYMALEPEGCFLAEVNGQEAGTATAISYGKDVGWIGMVLVHPDMRRYGIGTALLKRTIAYLQEKGVRSIKLDATPMGKKVYVPLGFADEYELQRFQGAASTPDLSAAACSGEIKKLDAGELEEIIEFDACYFGVRREEVLRSLAGRGEPYGLIHRENGRVTGYLMAHDGREAIQAGPWVAETTGSAEALFVTFLQQTSGRKVFLDVPCLNEAGTALMAKYGFEVQRGFARMYLGDNALPGKPESIYGTSGAEKG